MFNDFRCVDYGMNMNTMNFSKEQTTSNTQYSTTSVDTPAIDMAEQAMMHNNGYDGGCSMPGIVCPPVYECPVERCVHRSFVHEVPHVCPVNTRIINHHIYRHTYSPCYTCCEENEVSNVQEGNCCCFR